MDECGVANPLRGTNWQHLQPLDARRRDTRATGKRAIEAFFRTRTRAEIATEGRRRGINATVVAEPADVLADPHLEARGFWTTADGHESRAVRRSTVRTARSRPAATRAREPRSRSRRSARGRARARFFLGAGRLDHDQDRSAISAPTIIKVESRTRPCLSRIDVQVSASRADSFDDKPWFAHLNTSKRSLALDMKKPESREVLDPLIDWADVVVENFSPGTMAKLGLDYDALAARNPALIMVSGSVFGQTGPLAQEWGVDGTGAALRVAPISPAGPIAAPSFPAPCLMAT